MPLRWDPLLAAATARALQERMGGQRVRALLLDGSSRRVLLYLRDATLVAELHPTRGWISLLPATEPPPEARPLAARVRSVTVPPDESLILLRLRRLRGGAEDPVLALEFWGNRWNAVVLDEESGTIRHVLVPRAEGARPLLPGAPWQPLPPTGRIGSERPPSPDEWAEATHPGGEGEAKAILRSVAWTSSLNVHAFVGPGGRDRWIAATDPARWGSYLLRTDRGAQPYPVPLPGLPAEPRTDLFEAMAEARSGTEGIEPPGALLLPPALLERARAQVDRSDRRVRALRRELEQAGDPDELRAMGDLLLARFGQIPRGAERVTLTDFAGEPVEIPLDPSLPPHENAARYYDRAARLARAREELPGRIERAEGRLRVLEELLEQAATGAIPAPELERRLGGGPSPAKGAGRTGRGKGVRGRTSGPGATLPYRSFRSSGGLEIRVGRGARRNDELTFRHASPDDIWLHVRQAPGAHVVLVWGRRDERPPARDLAEAATLAALHSEARHSGSVPVDWTRRKYVRKPRGAAPGAVLPERIETLFVEPDPALPERLTPDDGPSPP